MNNSNGYQGKQPQKSHAGHRQNRKQQKEVPHAGLIMLREDGSNLVDWMKAISAHCEANYGTIASFLETGEYVQRTSETVQELTERFPGLTPANIQKLFLEATTGLIKQERRDTEAKSEIYALLTQVISTESMDRVSTRAGYEAARNARDPLALLNLIKNEHSLRMNNVSEAEAQYVATMRYHRLKQLPEVSLSDHLAHFELAVNNMKTLQCAGIPDEVSQARHIMMTLDKERHGDYVRSTINDERTKKIAPPTTPRGVIESARMFMSTSTQRQHRGGPPMVYKLNAKQAKYPCRACGELGHWARECPTKKQPSSGGSSQAGSNKSEDEVSKPNKESTSNTDKSGGTDKSADKKAKAAAYHVENRFSALDNDCEDDEDDPYGIFGYGVRVMKSTSIDIHHPNLVCIDSFANHSFVCNEKLLTDIKKQDLEVNGVHGRATVSQVGTIPGFGKALVTPGSNANGLALCEVEGRYKVEYEQGQHFSVEVDDQLTLMFEYLHELNSYGCMFTPSVIKALKERDEARLNYVNMMATTSDNENRYSKREVDRAAKARALMRRAFYPSDGALIRTLNKGSMVECSVIGMDVRNATDIYGRDVASIQGKTKDMGTLVDTRMEVTCAERKAQTIYGDIFTWRGVSFVMFIVKPLRLVMVQHIPKQTTSHMKSAVEKLCNMVIGKGFDVKEIVTDPAKALAVLKGLVRYNINTIGSRTHVADAEVEIRVLKERLRCSTVGTPFNVPRRLVRWQVYGCVKAYNIVLRPGQTVSAKESFTGIKPNFHVDFRAEFGEYVQAHVPPGHMERNGPKPRAVGAIALCPAGNDRGTWWFMALRSRGIFMADRWDTLPMPDIVIDILNVMYDEDERQKKGSPTNSRARNDTADNGPNANAETVPNNEPDASENRDAARRETDEEGEAMVPVHENRTSLEEVDNLVGPGSTMDFITPHNDENITSVHPDSGPVLSNDLQPTPSIIDSEETRVNKDEYSSEEVEEEIQQTEQEETGEHESLGTEEVDGQKKSRRIAARKVAGRLRKQVHPIHVNKISVRKALREDREMATKSILKELQQLVTRRVWKKIKRNSLSDAQLKKAIRSSMFLKRKYNAEGTFEKLKARLVAGGDQQDKTIYDTLSSPTVAHETVMIVLAIAAAKGRKIATADITGAYLECDMPDGDEVIMKLDPVISQILAQIDGEATKFQDEGGHIYVKLNKALYGCVQSARLWYEKLKGVLVNEGYMQNPYDECLFNKGEGDDQCTIAFHVDDLLITSLKETEIQRATSILKNNFQDITINNGKNHSYLGMNIVLEDEKITIDMENYIEKSCEGKEFGKRAATPATDTMG